MYVWEMSHWALLPLHLVGSCAPLSVCPLEGIIITLPENFAKSACNSLHGSIIRHWPVGSCWRQVVLFFNAIDVLMSCVYVYVWVELNMNKSSYVWSILSTSYFSFMRDCTQVKMPKIFWLFNEPPPSH